MVKFWIRYCTDFRVGNWLLGFSIESLVSCEWKSEKAMGAIPSQSLFCKQRWERFTLGHKMGKSNKKLSKTWWKQQILLGESLVFWKWKVVAPVYQFRGWAKRFPLLSGVLFTSWRLVAEENSNTLMIIYLIINPGQQWWWKMASGCRPPLSVAQLSPPLWTDSNPRFWCLVLLLPSTCR